jgi:hypothetical protein
MDAGVNLSDPLRQKDGEECQDCIVCNVYLSSYRLFQYFEFTEIKKKRDRIYRPINKSSSWNLAEDNTEIIIEMVCMTSCREDVDEP